LVEDHANAHRLAELVAGSAGLAVDLAAVETNIVNIDTRAPADALSRAARGHGVLINASGPHRLRAVTHLDVSRDDVEQAAKLLARAAAEAG
jgi:threonine aldolase